jgi:predicted transport protein
MRYSEIADPKNLCRDVTTVGHHGNGDIEASFSSLDQLDDVMELIHQAFEARWEE